MKISSLKPGDEVYSVERQKLGNTTISTVAVYSVIVTEVHEDYVMASWNCNQARRYGVRAVGKWKKTRPVLVDIGLGAKRLQTAAEKKAAKAAE